MMPEGVVLQRSTEVSGGFLPGRLLLALRNV
jgi:hypothetical protein